MKGARLALAGVVAALLAVVASGPGDSTGQTPDTAGLTYGGLKDQYAAWLRLGPGGTSIASMQIDWAVAPKRCSNRKTYSSTLYAGFEQLNPITVSQAGKFRRTIVDRYRQSGTLHEEHQMVSGTITGATATGSISGRVKIVQPNGRVVRCNFGPQRWRLVD
jgi:hypothetical protein